MIEVKEVKGVIEVNDDTLLPAKHLSITSRTSITSQSQKWSPCSMHGFFLWINLQNLDGFV